MILLIYNNFVILIPQENLHVANSPLEIQIDYSAQQLFSMKLKFMQQFYGFTNKIVYN